MRRSRQIYLWENDFPKSKQPKMRGQSVFSLVFDLNEDDRAAFRAEIHSKINSELPIEISVGRREPSFWVRKRGPGAQALTDKSKDIARFIGRRLELNHIEAVRKAEDAQAVVDAVVSRALSQIEESEELKEALETVTRLQRPVLDEIQSALAKSLKEFLPSVRSVSITPSQESRASALRSVDILIDDGQPTMLSQKGDGVISLTALALLTGIGLDEGVFATSRRGASSNTVLAIEEPESHLHPNAIHYIRQVIDSIASDKQILITTHSPLLVNRLDLGSNIIVENNAARICEKIEEIRESLGVRTADNLTSARVVLVCEGSDDVKKIVPLIRQLSPQLSSLLDQGELAIKGIGGAGKLSYHVSVLQNAICEVIALLDSDSSGNAAWEKASKSNLLDASDTFFTNVEGFKESELEDLLRPDFVRSFLVDRYEVDINAIRPADKDLKFSDRLSKAFKTHGKPFDDRIKGEVKNELSQFVGDHGPESFDGRRLAPVKALVARLERKFGLRPATS